MPIKASTYAQLFPNYQQLGQTLANIATQRGNISAQQFASGGDALVQLAKLYQQSQLNQQRKDLIAQNPTFIDQQGQPTNYRVGISPDIPQQQPIDRNAPIRPMQPAGYAPVTTLSVPAPTQRVVNQQGLLNLLGNPTTADYAKNIIAGLQMTAPKYQFGAPGDIGYQTNPINTSAPQTINVPNRPVSAQQKDPLLQRGLIALNDASLDPTTQNAVRDWVAKRQNGDMTTPFPTLTKSPASSSGSISQNDAKSIVQAIREGKQAPDSKGMYRAWASVRTEAAKQGFDLATAEKDWMAVSKHITTMNGAQQERLRQAITFANDTLPQLEEAYAQWKKDAGVSGIKLFNKANLIASENLSGNASSSAKNLQALIADFTSELGTVYKGGNSSTDESLKLAAQNLSADWNEKTFSDAIKRLQKSIEIRKASIYSSMPVGMSPTSPYSDRPQQPTADYEYDPATGTLKKVQ